MSKLLTISGVRGYIDAHGTAQLNLEDVARGLGFIENKSGKEYVMWRRVNQYLFDLKFGSADFFGTIAEEQFIPENIFYRLAMKAKNETAEKFQSVVADEILPAIRKTGTYSTQPQLTKMQILELAIESEKKVLELQATITDQKPKVLLAESITASEKSILISELAKILKQNGIEIGQNRLFEWMRCNGYLGKKNGDNYNLPTQKAMDMKLFEIKKTAINHSNGIVIERTAKVTGKGQLYFINKFLSNEGE